MQNNDKILLVEVYNKEPIVMKQFDTPLQIAHRFCNENKLEMKYCKTISQIVIRIMKTYSDENQQLEGFKKYYENVEPFQKKKVYTLNEILNNQEKENQQQQLQLQDQYYSFNKNEENKVIPPIVYKSPKDIQLLEQKQPKNKIDTKKLEDLGRKLYQNILSPSPEQSPQLNYSQTTKHVSILQRQLQQSQQISNNQKKSVERLNKSTHLKLFKQNSSFLDSTEKKKQLPIFNHHNNHNNNNNNNNNNNTTNNKKKVQPRSISNGKQRCKTEVENDRLQRLGYKIFQLMDSDRDGGISPTAIDLSAISDEMLNFLIPILMEIDNKQLKLNAFQFYQLFESQFDKLDQTAKSRILNN